MARKSDVVRELVAHGEFKSALRVAKEFKIGFTPSEQETLKYTYEYMLYPDWYAQIGHDIAPVVDKGIKLLMERYG